MELDEFWKNIEGLYVGTQTDFSPDGEEIKERDLGTDGTYDFSNIKIFANWTVDGSRLYATRYSLIGHNGDSAGIFVPAASYCKFKLFLLAQHHNVQPEEFRSLCCSILVLTSIITFHKLHHRTKKMAKLFNLHL